MIERSLPYLAGFLTISAVLILVVGRWIIQCFAHIEAMERDR